MPIARSVRIEFALSDSGRVMTRFLFATRDPPCGPVALFQGSPDGDRHRRDTQRFAGQGITPLLHRSIVKRSVLHAGTEGLLTGGGAQGVGNAGDLDGTGKLQ